MLKVEGGARAWKNFIKEFMAGRLTCFNERDKNIIKGKLNFNDLNTYCSDKPNARRLMNTFEWYGT